MTPLRFAKEQLLTWEGGPVADWPALGVAGDPVAHSLSPRLHAAALQARGQPGVLRAIHVAAEDLAGFLRQARRHAMEGLSLTLPHKVAALALAAEIDPVAARLGATNALVAAGPGWAAHNTDAAGLALALRTFAPAGALSASRACLVVGAGGAARAAVGALIELGMSDICVVARRRERAAWAADRGLRVVSGDARALRGCDILIQATPLGLRTGDAPPVDPAALPAGAFVVDLTYGTAPSRLLAASRLRGCATLDGLPMLVAQAALAFVLWRGGEPPLQVMAESVGLRWR